MLHFPILRKGEPYKSVDTIRTPHHRTREMFVEISQANPGLILLSTCLPGQTGTLELPGYGNLSTGLFGFTTTTRWPDRPAANTARRH